MPSMPRHRACEQVPEAARVAGVSGTLDYAVSGTYFRTDGTPTARNGTRDMGSAVVAAVKAA